jgi:hypothetical protein
MTKPNKPEEFLDTTAPTLILDDDDEEEEPSPVFSDTHPDLVDLVDFFEEETPEDLKDMESDLLR